MSPYFQVLCPHIFGGFGEHAALRQIGRGDASVPLSLRRAGCIDRAGKQIARRRPRPSALMSGNPNARRCLGEAPCGRMPKPNGNARLAPGLEDTNQKTAKAAQAPTSGTVSLLRSPYTLPVDPPILQEAVIAKNICLVSRSRLAWSRDRGSRVPQSHQAWQRT